MFELIKRCSARNFEGSLLRPQSHPNKNRAEEYSANSSYIPVPDGRFLANTENASDKAA